MHAALAAVALIPALALTQVPGKMSYQGRILQPDGNPEVGPVNVTFAIYSTDTNGTALWSEAQKLALTNGYYSTVLGGGDTPLPNNVFDGGLRYLSVTVGGTELLPRQPIASVPYAMSAGRLVGPSAALGGVLRANWQLNENTGLTAADSSGAGNTGTFTTGTFGWVASGHTGPAVSFVGSGEMIAAASPSLDITDEITLEAWVFIPVGTTGNNTVVSREGAYLMSVANVGGGGGTLSCSMVAPGQATSASSVGGAVPLATWTHVACTYDGSALRNYINEVLVATTAAPYGPMAVSIEPLRVGGRGPTQTEYFNGKIDEVRITAIAKSFGGGSATPVGTVITSMLTEAQMQAVYGPAWILADGRAVAGSRYAAITGSATVPDLRGLFMRAKNNGRNDGKHNPDGELALGSYQADQLTQHGHAVADPGHLHQLPTFNGVSGSHEIGNNYYGLDWAPYEATAVATTGITVGNFSAQGMASGTAGNETRGRNATLNFFIRIN